jgi:hypothetical protein
MKTDKVINRVFDVDSYEGRLFGAYYPVNEGDLF